MRPIHTIVLHHTGSKTCTTLALVRELHVVERGWSDVGYHFVVEPGGLVRPARPLHRIGAHVQDHNTGSIGVCLAGDFSDESVPGREQWRQGVILVADLCRQFGLSAHQVVGHRDLAQTLCPGYDTSSFRAEVEERLALGA